MSPGYWWCDECGRVAYIHKTADTGRTLCVDCHPRLEAVDGEARLVDRPGVSVPDGGTNRQATIHESARNEDSSLADVDVAEDAEDARDPNAPEDSGGDTVDE